MKHGPCFAFSSDFLARSLVSFGFLSHVKRLRRHLGNLLFAGRQCQGFAPSCRQTKRSAGEIAQEIPARCDDIVAWARIFSGTAARPAGRRLFDLSRRSKRGTVVLRSTRDATEQGTGAAM
jgi:hypothetical protein